MSSNVAVTFVFAVGLPLFLLWAGVRLTLDEDNAVYIVCGGLLSALAIPVGTRIWKWKRGLMLTVAGALVSEFSTVTADPPPRVTNMEGDTFRELRDLLGEARTSAVHARDGQDPTALSSAAPRWSEASRTLTCRVSFGQVSDRCRMIEQILYAGANQTDPADVRLFSEIAIIIIDDVDEAFKRHLTHKKDSQAAPMWPYVFDKLAAENEREHGGRPVTFRNWLEKYKREHPTAE